MVAGRWRRAARVGLVVSLAIAFDGRPSAGGDAAPAAGMEAHVDPATGRFVPEPVVPRPPEPVRTFPPPVLEPAPGGGMMSVLHGRFKNAMVATVDADGTLHVDCRPQDGPLESPQP